MDMSEWLQSFRSRMEEPVSRCRFLQAFYVLLAFLIPVIGWNPILALGVVRSIIHYRKNADSRFRFVFAAIGALFSALILVNLYTRYFL